MKFLFAKNRKISKTEAFGMQVLFYFDEFNILSGLERLDVTLSERYLLGVNQIHFNFLHSLHFSVALSPNSVSISVTNVFIITGKNVLKPDLVVANVCNKQKACWP